MSLFVNEDEDFDMKNTSVMDCEEDDLDDPIVEEIPIYMNYNSQTDAQKIYILQFPTRNAVTQFAKTESESVSQTRMKPGCGVIEVDIPMNVERFFDEEKSSKWLGTNSQTLKGVFAPAEGYYAGLLEQSEDGKKGLYLNPISKTAQLRASFRYIDDLKSQKQIKEREMIKNLNKEMDEQSGNGYGASAEDKKKQVRVVQMTAKSTGENVPRLGGALVSKKMEEEEEYVDYHYLNTSSYDFNEVKKSLMSESNEVLVCKDSQDEYLSRLLQGTFTD